MGAAMTKADRLILHIGQPKTGTTTLQSALHNASAALEACGVHYMSRPVINGNRFAAHLSAMKFQPRMALQRTGGDAQKVASESRRDWLAAVERQKTSSCKTVVLSSETLYDFGPLGAVDDLLSHLDPLAHEIVVVAYIRAPADLYLSLLQENLKFGFTLGPSGPNDTYRLSLKPYDDHPRVTLHVHKFGRADLIGQDIVTDFATRYLPPDARKVLSNRGDDRNETISAEMMAVLEERGADSTRPNLNGHGPVTMAHARRFIALDQATPGFGRPRYRSGIARIIHDHSQDLDWLEEKFGISFDRPEGNPAVTADVPLQTVRDLCIVDEDRFEALASAFPSAGRLKFNDFVASRSRRLTRLPRRLGKLAMQLGPRRR